MALLWADGFDHYGTDPNGGRDAMLEMGWVALAGQPAIGTGEPPRVSADVARTGSHALRLAACSANNTTAARINWARRALPGLEAGGVALGVYLPQLGGDSGTVGVGLRSESNWIVRLSVEADGSIAVRTGTGATGTVEAQSVPVIGAAAWHHVELRFVIDGASSEVEVRVDGAVAVQVSGIALGSSPASLLHLGGIAIPVSGDPVRSYVLTYWDDVVAWDQAGAQNNTFLGPFTRVFSVFPGQDTAQADWQPVGGSPPPAGYSTLAKAAPDDDTYIESENAPAGSPPAGGDVSEFALEPLPEGIGSVRGVHLVSRMAVTDLGGAEVAVGLRSDAQVTDTGAHVVSSQEFAGYHDVIEQDPATAAPWTRDALSAALLRFARTG